MSSFPYDAVIFDLDGTLCDAEEGIVSSALYAMKALGREIPKGAELRTMVGPPLHDSFVGLFELTPELAQVAIDFFREHYAREGMYLYKVYPLIRTILQMLRHAGVHTAVATSKPIQPTRVILDHYGLTHYFDKIVGVEDDDHIIGKPELVRKALPAKYRHAAMVGDRRFDMEGALANQIDGIGVEYGCGTTEELRSAGATHIVPDTEALLALLCPGAERPRGFFLTVEGPDGSGKTTQVDLLAKNLRDYGFDVLHTREPGGCRISEDIRRIILDTANMEMCPACEALLYAAARAQHVNQVIRPAVEKGKLVLCDRFVDSSIAYQGGGRELGLETVRQINAPAVAGMIPDATLYLEIDHKVGLKRRLGERAPDRLELEASEFYGRVQKTYEQLIKKDRGRYLIVNADQEIEAVAKDALSAALGRLEPEMKEQ